MTFIHCLACGVCKADGIRVFITNCKHIFCKVCIESNGKFCPICKTPAKFMELTQNMPKSVRSLFEDVTEKSKEVMTAYTYQIDHAHHFISLRMKLKSLFGEEKIQQERIKDGMRRLHEYKLKEHDLMSRVNNELVLVRATRRAARHAAARRVTPPPPPRPSPSKSMFDSPNVSLLNSTKSSVHSSARSIDSRQPFANVANRSDMGSQRPPLQRKSQSMSSVDQQAQMIQQKQAMLRQMPQQAMGRPVYSHHNSRQDSSRAYIGQMPVQRPHPQPQQQPQNTLHYPIVSKFEEERLLERLRNTQVPSREAVQQNPPEPSKLPQDPGLPQPKKPAPTFQYNSKSEIERQFELVAKRKAQYQPQPSRRPNKNVERDKSPLQPVRAQGGSNVLQRSQSSQMYNRSQSVFDAEYFRKRFNRC